MDYCIGIKPLTIGILILNRNGKNWLSTIYDSIRFDGHPNLRLYLVDNGSDDGSVELTIERYPEVNVIRMPQNLGYCMAYNLAMPYAFADGCEWVILSNNDIRIESGCLNDLVRVARSDSRIGILGPAFFAWESDDPNYYIVGNHPYAIQAMKSKSREPIDVEWVEGSFLMVSRRCVEAVGPLDPYLFFYWEEADFCRRARYQGWRVVLVPSAIARHYARGSINPQNQAIVNIYRSRNYYIYKLSNPLQTFTQNLKDAIHLFLVNIKSNFPGQMTSLKSHIRIFAEVIRDIRVIYKKWVRDCMRKHPPVLTEKFESIRVEFIPRQQ